ncbi:DUF2726 domain-containing protein [Alteromonas sediminis]|uniref:DUF2726 domain-containing protein n=1 Tax=Alteromonas sediminis TaxID=2259342 RepID=A0A3N5Y2F2_9ALTE|nr:DUF2726 domain-containing protein [Alteromonas sediminis]RPJ67872.1 DUF2726 domain-containing protein [Alteromonas sediminis]
MELAIILMMILIVVSAGAMALSVQNTHYPFRRKGQLFTPVEHTFLQLLEQAVNNEFRIMCRVKLSDIVTVSASTKKKQASTALSRASAKSIDFVLCNKSDMQPVLAIDLVHKQGADGYKVQKDLFVSNALDGANIPHARIKVKSGYSVEEIRECIETKLIPMRRRQQKLTESRLNPERPNKPTRPLRSSRVAA